MTTCKNWVSSSSCLPLTSQAKDQECGGKKENKSYSQRKKGGEKEIALICLLGFAEENKLFASIGTGRYYEKWSVCGVTAPARVT